METSGYMGTSELSASKNTMYVCPSDKDPRLIDSYGVDTYISYGLNVAITGYEPWEDGYEWHLCFREIEQLAKGLEGTAWMTDCFNTYVIRYWCWVNNAPELGQYYASPRHSRGGNFLFTDGHVSWLAAPYGKRGQWSRFLKPSDPNDVRY